MSTTECQILNIGDPCLVCVQWTGYDPGVIDSYKKLSITDTTKQTVAPTVTNSAYMFDNKWMNWTTIKDNYSDQGYCLRLGSSAPVSSKIIIGYFCRVWLNAGEVLSIKGAFDDTFCACLDGNWSEVYRVTASTEYSFAAVDHSGYYDLSVFAGNINAYAGNRFGAPIRLNFSDNTTWYRMGSLDRSDRFILPVECDKFDLTDYLFSKHSSYVVTSDTSIQRFKRYYRLTMDGYRPILIFDSSANPGKNGWAEFRSRHGAEYRDHVEALQMNGIDTICRSALAKLRSFPKTNLEREIDGLDFASNFLDSKFDEVIGTVHIGSYAVAFDVNMYISKYMQTIMDSIQKSGWTNEIEQFIDNIPTTSIGTNYRTSGYTFDPSTLGSTSRTEDVYTCISYWEEIEFKKAKYILESVTPSTDYKYKWNTFLNATLPNAVRTMVDLMLRIQAVEIVDATTLSAKTTTVPGTITKDSTTYYRLINNEQLVDNTYCCLAMYNHATSTIEYRDPELVISALAKFAQLSLSNYNVYRSTVDQEIPISMLDRGLVWYTTVPFSGV